MISRCLAEQQVYTSSSIPSFSSFCDFSKWHWQTVKRATVDAAQQLTCGWLSRTRSSCIGWPTSHLVLQAQNDLDSLLQDDKLGLGLVALQVDLTHPAQLSEGFVNVANTHPLPGIVSLAALPLPLLLLFGSQVLIGHRDNTAAGRRRRGWRGWLTNPYHNPLRTFT